MNEPVSYPAAAANSQTVPHNHERSLKALVVDIREEAKAFLFTRAKMIKAELQETLGAFKVGLPLALLALGLLSIAGMLFSAAIVILVASAFAGSPYAWFFAFIIVGALWSVFAAVAGFFAFTQFRGRFPKRTFEVIKADKMWLQTEARIRV